MTHRLKSQSKSPQHVSQFSHQSSKKTRLVSCTIRVFLFYLFIYYTGKFNLIHSDSLSIYRKPRLFETWCANKIVWIIALILGLLGILCALTDIPLVTEYNFWFVVVGWLLLIIATAVKGFWNPVHTGVAKKQPLCDISIIRFQLNRGSSTDLMVALPLVWIVKIYKHTKSHDSRII